MIDLIKICVEVNGQPYEAEVEPRLLLADFLRHHLGFTGVHVGCEHGVCGACTVLYQDCSARSCLMFAVQANGKAITTTEGLSNKDGSLSPLQEAFIEHNGLQCGFCTPGVLITLTEHLRDNHEPTEDSLRLTLTGNLCRCTGYQSIVESALDAAQRMKTQLPETRS